MKKSFDQLIARTQTYANFQIDATNFIYQNMVVIITEEMLCCCRN